MQELRQLLSATEGSRQEGLPKILPFGLAALDSHLPEGGLAGGGLHEIVPETAGRIPGRLRLSSWRFWPASAAGFPLSLRHAGLCASPIWPAFRTWPQRARSRSRPPDPGRDRAPQRNAVGDGGSVAFGGAARRRRDDRQARSEDQPKAASRRQRFRAAALVVAAGANAGSKRRGNALAHRHGGSRARPLRPLRAPPMASAA